MVAASSSRAFLLSSTHILSSFYLPPFHTAIAATIGALQHSLPFLNLMCPLSVLLYFSSSSSVRCVQETLATQKATRAFSILRRPNVVDILKERGLLESLTNDGLRLACSDPILPPLRIYCGFDPTVESLHLGNLLGIIVLFWFLRCSHNIVTLIGGTTGCRRPLLQEPREAYLDTVTLERNIVRIANNVRWIRSGSGGNSFVILNNYDWWKDVKLLDFLREVGRFARVGTMISKESVKKRLESEQGMSYIEFTYKLLQGYARLT